MDTIFMNSKYGKTSDRHRLLLNLTDKMDLRKKDDYIPLSNLSIYYTWKNIKMSYKNKIYLKILLHHVLKNLNYLMDHII